MAQQNKNPQDNGLNRALPKNAVYFDLFRTDAYENKNLTKNYVDFYVAIKTGENVKEVQDPGVIMPRQEIEGRWRVMHYVVFDLGKEDGLFKAEIDTGFEDVSFIEAINRLAVHEEGLKYVGANEKVDLSEDKFPADKFPELKEHYFDIEHYRLAGNIEGLVFDRAGTPHKRLNGLIITNSTFEHGEMAKPSHQTELAREHPNVVRKIETGFLSDVFNTSATQKVSLDHRLSAMETLSYLDNFALNIGAFYISTQRVIGEKEGFDNIASLSAKDKKTILKEASDLIIDSRDSAELLTFRMPDLLSKAAENITELEQRGAHVEPFQKLVAECDLFLNLLSASKTLESLTQSLTTSGTINRNAITEIKRTVDAAQEKFTKLGGSSDEVDRLKAWIADTKKDTTPVWLSSFIDRFYNVRGKVAKRLQERENTAPREVKTMSAKANPPSIWDK